MRCSEAIATLPLHCQPVFVSVLNLTFCECVYQCATFKATPSVGMRLQELRALYRDKDNAYGNANVHYMLLRVFDTFDVDGDGFLSQQEIYAMKEASGRRSFGRVREALPR